MEKIMNFLKTNFYYVLGGFIIFVIIIVIVIACSATNSSTKDKYAEIEANMITAAQNYYIDRKNMLPSTQSTSSTVSVDTLVNNKYMKKIKDPSDKKEVCTGDVEVTLNSNNSFYYEPYLVCGTYKTSTLSKKITANTKKDENGNGLYAMDSDYVFRGDTIKNYIEFNDSLWRILRVDSDGDIKIIKVTPKEASYIWDNRYNLKEQAENGINNFTKSRIKTTNPESAINQK